MIDSIIGLLVISGIGAVLALLLEIADSYIADYGERQILVNNKKDLLVKGGKPLLFSLVEENIFIPSACGGKGTCAHCKVKISEGGGPILPTETPHLTGEELADNVRISCQVKVKEDMKIEIPEEFFLIREFQVRVEKIEALTDHIKGISLHILSFGEGIEFKPGQYVQLQIPPYKLSRTSEYRAYSIASHAGDFMRVDLVIAKVEGGIVSTYVHDYMKEGEELTLRGPFGEFYLRESDRDILFIATGSGLAPIMSMLHQIESEGIKRKSTLFFGNRKRKDLYFIDRIKAFEKTIKNFTFLPTLSRVTEEDSWEGERGRVTDLIKKYIPDKAEIDVYICGSPGMVESCVELLTQKGIPEEHIFFDKFE